MSEEEFDLLAQKGHKVTTLPAYNSLEQNIIEIAEYHQDTIEPGHGLFFDFEQTPELGKGVIDYLVKGFKWTQEKHDFIRKPEN